MNQFDIQSLDTQLKKIQENLHQEEKKLNEISLKVNQIHYNDLNDIDENSDNSDKLYQKYNKEYKQFISNFSFEYLELCEWYVGPELPQSKKQTFLNSKDDINLLYVMFLMGFFMKP